MLNHTSAHHQECSAMAAMLSVVAARGCEELSAIREIDLRAELCRPDGWARYIGQTSVAKLLAAESRARRGTETKLSPLVHSAVRSQLLRPGRVSPAPSNACAALRLFVSAAAAAVEKRRG